MEKLTVSNNLRDTIGMIGNQKAVMLAHADAPNRNGRVYTREAINHAFANYEATHRINHKSLRLERNWEEAKKEEPRYFSGNKLRKLTYRQAKKRLTLAAYWE